MSVRTTVRFSVEITKSGKFGNDWKLGDLKRTAIREAEETLRKIVGCSPKDIRIIGKPKTINCIYSEDL